jgi:hypothetical protein
VKIISIKASNSEAPALLMTVLLKTGKLLIARIMKIDIKISAGVVFKLTTLHPVKTFAACITSTSVLA